MGPSRNELTTAAAERADELTMFADEQEHEANHLNGNALLSSHRQFVAMLEGAAYMRQTADLLRQLIAEVDAP